MTRVYLDHNATTPLRAEARTAMMAAMDVLGNPSSVHAEGRAAKGLLETARAQVAQLVGCGRQQVIFTSGATEAAALAVAQKARHGGAFVALPTEHDCFVDWSEVEAPSLYGMVGGLDAQAQKGFARWVSELGGSAAGRGHPRALMAWSAANSETGILTPDGLVPGNMTVETTYGQIDLDVVSDLTQVAGKVPLMYGTRKPAYAVLSAHKLGGPKGVGALINFTAEDPQPILRGGGQEMGRRSGTENIIGIAGFGAAAEAAVADLAAGRWDEIAELRNILENALEAGANTTIFVGKGCERLPNTSCFITPGWTGERQVIQMDLSGFAISAGSACSSGKVRPSRVLRAMGFDSDEAASAVRVSLGLDTTKDDVLRFCETWLEKERKFRARAA